jgi:hypothetical protein
MSGAGGVKRKRDVVSTSSFRSRKSQTKQEDVEAPSKTRLELLRSAVVDCVDMHVHVGPKRDLAHLVADYAFVLEHLLGEATCHKTKTRRALDMWLGRLTEPCDSDEMEQIPWFTGSGCALIRFLVECNWSSTNIMRHPCDMFPDFRREWLDVKKDVQKDRHCFVEPSPIVVYDGISIASHEHPNMDEFLGQNARNEWFYISRQGRDIDMLVRYPRGIGVSETPDMKTPPWTFGASYVRRICLPGACVPKNFTFMEGEIACYWVEARESYRRFVSKWSTKPIKKWRP